MSERAYTAEQLRAWLSGRGYGETRLPFANMGSVVFDLAEVLEENASLTRELEAARAALRRGSQRCGWCAGGGVEHYRWNEKHVDEKDYEAVRLAHEGAPR